MPRKPISRIWPNVIFTGRPSACVGVWRRAERGMPPSKRHDGTSHGSAVALEASWRTTASHQNYGCVSHLQCSTPSDRIRPIEDWSILLIFTPMDASFSSQIINIFNSLVCVLEFFRWGIGTGRDIVPDTRWDGQGHTPYRGVPCPAPMSRS